MQMHFYVIFCLFFFFKIVIWDKPIHSQNISSLSEVILTTASWWQRIISKRLKSKLCHIHSFKASCTWSHPEKTFIICVHTKVSTQAFPREQSVQRQTQRHSCWTLSLNISMFSNKDFRPWQPRFATVYLFDLSLLLIFSPFWAKIFPR